MVPHGRCTNGSFGSFVCPATVLFQFFAIFDTLTSYVLLMLYLVPFELKVELILLQVRCHPYLDSGFVLYVVF